MSEWLVAMRDLKKKKKKKKKNETGNEVFVWIRILQLNNYKTQNDDVFSAKG